MKQEFFISQRLGFSNAQADLIRQIGIETFMKRSLNAPNAVLETPKFFDDAPRTRDEYRGLKQKSDEEKKKLVASEVLRNIGFSHVWLSKMTTDELPLREKMTLFWHNHFVSGYQKVRVSWAMFQQNQLLREHAFGNYRELTRRILYNNAMLIYLDNTQNKAKTPNENLSRELLELFTLGVGNYSESDIKEGARALAGLSLDDNGGKYYRFWEDNSDKTYFGKTGNWKADDLVNIIFKQPKAGRRLMEKFLKYFVSDNPSVQMLDDYTSAFQKADFEMKPMLEKLSRDERFIKSQGLKIKDPLSFLTTTLYEFQLELPPARQLVPYFKEQSMVLLNPPNVKGWDGGQMWLSSQRLLQRVGVVSTLASGKSLDNFKFKKKQERAADDMQMDDISMRNQTQMAEQKPVFRWDKTLDSNKKIIESVASRLVFTVSADMQTDMERLLKYDFKPTEPTAQDAVTRLAEYIMKSPEFQIC